MSLTKKWSKPYEGAELALGPGIRIRHAYEPLQQSFVWPY